jgi:hypothetical protein
MSTSNVDSINILLHLSETPDYDLSAVTKKKRDD